MVNESGAGGDQVGKRGRKRVDGLLIIIGGDTERSEG